MTRWCSVGLASSHRVGRALGAAVPRLVCLGRRPHHGRLAGRLSADKFVCGRGPVGQAVGGPLVDAKVDTWSGRRRLSRESRRQVGHVKATLGCGT